MASSAMEIRSPAVRRMSSSRSAGRSVTEAARSSSSSVVSPMADTTTTTSLPASLVSTIRFATRLRLAASATDDPPNFCTTRGTRGLRWLGSGGAGRKWHGPGTQHSVCRSRMPGRRPSAGWEVPVRVGSAGQDVPAEPGDVREDDDEEDDPAESAALGHGHAGADVAAGEVGDAERQAEPPDDGAVGHEEDERTEVRREVDDLRERRRREERVAEHGDEADDEERAGAGSEEPVVGADDEAEARRGEVVPASAPPQVGPGPETRPGDGPRGDGDEDDEDDRGEQLGGDLCGERRAPDRTDECGERHRRRGAEVRSDPPVVRERADRRAHDRAELVRRERLDRADPRHEEESGQLDEPATPDDRVDPARGERGEQE